MGPVARPGRPFVVMLIALLPLALAVWYAISIARDASLFVGEFLFGGPAPVPADVRFGPLVLAAAAFVAMIWSFYTIGGLLGGANWARVSAVLLAFFVLPFGYPTDLIATAIILFFLFIPGSVRAFFR